MPRRYTPIPENPLILSTDEVALRVLRRPEAERRDARTRHVRSAVEHRVIPPPLNPKRRIDCWLFSMAEIERWLRGDRHPSGRAS